MSEQRPDHRAERPGGLPGFAELYSRHAERLRRMVDLRLDTRVQARLGASDVLQEVFLEAAESFPRYREQSPGSFYLWLRCIAARKLIDLQRHHLGAQARDARRELSLERALEAPVSSRSIALQLVARTTSPSQAAIRKETCERVVEALDRMEPLDREVLALRHLEDLSNVEAAAVLGIEPPAASKRYGRALLRLREVLRAV